MLGKNSKTILIALAIGQLGSISTFVQAANTPESGTVYGGYTSSHMPNANSRYGWTIAQELGPDGWTSTGESRNKRISIGVESNYEDKTLGFDKFTGKTITAATGGVNASISVGNETYKRQIKNVENGIDPYDAVNISQLNAVAEKISNIGNYNYELTTTASEGQLGSSGTVETIDNGERITFDAGKNIKLTQNNNTISIATSDRVATVEQMTQVKSDDGSVRVVESTNADGAKVYDLSVQSIDNGRINALANEIGRVGAQGAALAALKPIQYDPLEPTQIMAGYGNYHGNSALALGVAHYKNESTMIHGGISWAAGNDNHMMANAGITWKVGSRDSEVAIADRYRKGPISSAYALQNEMAAIKAENTGLKGEVDNLKAENQEMKAENQEMKAENQEMKAQIAMLMQRLGL